jgi:CRISPR-associated protein Cmr4
MSFFFEQGTEVRARIRLQEATKVVAKGALWYEESLPAETLLLSFITAFPPKHVGLTAQEVFKQIAELIKTPLQFGGNATVGQGLCSLKIAGGTQ